MENLTKEEKQAIEQLQKLANNWPKSLWLISDCGSLSIRKPEGKYYSKNTEVATIYGIPNDGGDTD